ncbi:ornithine cyclodeaminase family protein [Rothia sp. CCM 9418]|uniref:ornithine cyclodeaminase family protein n=1 Tax=Rothia sp. CCM 9418 TaxID=3402661 RepID=UPI003AED36C1
MSITYLSYQNILEHFSPAQAVHALRETLKNGYDPSCDYPRQKMDMPYAQLLMMPSYTRDSFGMKVLSCADTSVRPDVPLIQGSYLLFNAQTLAPTHVLDGVALTDIRTSAVSIAGVYPYISGSSEPLKTVIFGCGAQGRAHLKTLENTLEAIRPVEHTFISRTQPEDITQWVQADSQDAADVLKQAELILCTTTSSTPLFEVEDISPHAVIVAVGSHTPQAREVSSSVMEVAEVIVEDIATALRECGDVICAIEDGVLAEDKLYPLCKIVSGDLKVRSERPIVFKTSGMGWEDLTLAEAIVRSVQS